MIGYVVPASFLGGPEFLTFRHRILQLAEVLVIDTIEKRSDVFLYATQDACFVVLRRRANPLTDVPLGGAKSGVLRASGGFHEVGEALLEGDGGPWKLPGIERTTSGSILDWGIAGTIGYLVANRRLGSVSMPSRPREAPSDLGQGRLCPAVNSISSAELHIRTSAGWMLLRQLPISCELLAWRSNAHPRAGRNGG